MNAASVRQALERILASPGFDASARNRRFLEYVVEETLAGRASRLKGLTVAMDVFGRDATFDAQHDPVVRIEAAKLRRGLERYYLTAGHADPIRIDIPKGSYVPQFHDQDSLLDPTRPPLGAGRRRIWIAVTAVGCAITVLAVAAASSWLTGASADRDATPGAAGMQLAGPAVVIAPFENLSGTEAGRLLAGGLTQELITDLMRFKDLRVYSATSNQRWTNDPASFGEELQVAYEVTGSVLRAPDQVRLAVQLLELGSGRYVWSETYDRPLTAASIFDIQEAVVAELAGRLAEPHSIIHAAAADLLRHHRPATLFAYDCVLQAFGYRQTYSRELYLSARNCLEQAVRDDPGYAAAWAMLAYAHLDEYRWYGWGPMFGMPAALDQALEAAQRAREFDPDDVMSLSAYAAVQFYRGEFAEAETVQRRAIELNPNNPERLAQLGWRVAFAQNWDQGIGLVREAARRSMAERGWYYLFLGMDDYRRGDYRSALANLGRLGGPFFFIQPALVAMCQAELGHEKEARRALQQALTADPTFAKDPRGAFRLHRMPEDLIDQFMAGLRKAGLEEPAA